MAYVAHITVPVSFDASDDAQALDILTRLRDMLASVAVRDIPGIPAGAAPEVIDYPDADMSEVLPYAVHRAIDVHITDVTEYRD